MKVSHFKENVYEVIKHPVHSLGEKKKHGNYKTISPKLYILYSSISVPSLQLVPLVGMQILNNSTLKSQTSRHCQKQEVQPLKFNLTTVYKEFSKSFFLSLLQIRESVFIWSLTPSSFISNPIYYFS